LRTTFRRRLIVAFTVPVVVLALTSAALATLTARARLKNAIEDDFARAPEVLTARLSDSFARFKRDLAVWAEDPRYAAWLGRASGLDSPGGRPRTEDLRAAHDGLGALAISSWDELRVTNDTGVLLLDVTDQDALGDDLSKDAAVAEALAGRPRARLRGALLELALPVSVEGEVRGVLVAGTHLAPIRDDAAAILHARLTLHEARPDETPQSFERDGQTWLSTLVPLAGVDATPIGWARLERSLTAELTPQVRALALALLVATGAGLFVAFALALRLSRAVAAPVVALSAATEQIRRGNYDHRVPRGEPDELGTLGDAFNEMAAGLKQRVFFESALRRYLAPPVVDRLVAEPERLRLGGERREITVLFFDVAGFTSLSETMEPEALVALANGYLDPLVEAVFRHGGTFDKFIGDAIMAFWGAPLDQPDHAQRACLAALEMQAALHTFAAGQSDARLRNLRGRIGLNTGIAALGNLGSSQVMNYTAMGDAVNVASRLEGLNKTYGTSTLAAESTARAAQVPSREVDRVRVVGRATPLGVFELLGKDAPPQAARDAYAEGLKQLSSRAFARAEQEFLRAQQLGDGPCAQVMAKRAAQLQLAPPPSDWDGAFTAEHK
jgi:class 3 adenylate cyclase